MFYWVNQIISLFKMSNRIDDEAFKRAIATYIERFGDFNPFDPNFVYITTEMLIDAVTSGNEILPYD